MNVFGLVKQPKAKCSKCNKIWDIYGNPKYTDMMGFLVINSCNSIYNPKSKDCMKCKKGDKS